MSLVASVMFLLDVIIAFGNMFVVCIVDYVWGVSFDRRGGCGGGRVKEKCTACGFC